jgi:hypothetical protein
MVAGVGAGVYASAAQAWQAVADTRPTIIQPRPAAHARYTRLYEDGYLLFQAPLRRYGQRLAAWN